MDENEAREKYLIDGKWADGVYTDPYIKLGDQWELYSAKDPIKGKALMTSKVLLNPQEIDSAINKIVIPSFKAIEKSWKNISTSDSIPEEAMSYFSLFTIRQWAASAYRRNNEFIAKNVLDFRPIPGEFKGCVDLNETTGGLVWAVQ